MLNEDNEIDQAIEKLINSNNPKDVAARRALQDFKIVRGQIIEVNHVVADCVNEENSINVWLEPPALVRVHQKNTLDRITHSYHDFIDPEWNAELVEPHPNLNPREFIVDSLTVFGTIYNTITGNPHLNYSKWKLVEPKPITTETMEVEKQTIKQNLEKIKAKDETDDPSLVIKENRKDRRNHASNIARIIASGLISNQGEISLRKAIKLYEQLTQNLHENKDNK